MNRAEPEDAEDAPDEIELKLEFDPGDRARLAAELSRRAGAAGGRTETFVTPYFDTPDRDLQQAGISLRIRRSGAQRTQTVKAGRTGAGLFARREWEAPVTGDRLDHGLLAATRLAPLDDAEVREKLRRLFAIRVRRQSFRLRHLKAIIEATIDDGVAEARGRTDAISELELELKQGPVSALFALALALDRVVPLRLGILTKSERGFALVAQSAPAPAKARPIELDRGASAGAAFRTIGRDCLHHLLVNEPALRLAEAPGAVHQMRVAIRRLRVAMSVFKPVVGDAEFGRIRAELKWFADVLGPARELDVFLERSLRPARERHPDAKVLTRFEASLVRRRKAASEKALKALASVRFRRLVLATSRWIEVGPWTRDAAPERSALRDGPAADFAAAVLKRRRKRVATRGAELEALAPPARHDLRIAVKKLRYAVEFFRPLFGRRKRQSRLGEALEILQDRLGELNDMSQGASAILGEPAARSRDAAAVAALIADDQAESEDALIEAAKAAHGRVAAAKPYWG